MKPQEDKALENFIDKVMQETVIESPSIGFTNQIMSQVEALKSPKTTTYQPLISKPGWSIIGFAILATCVYLFLNTPSLEVSWLSNINFDSITNNGFTQAVSGFKISKTLMYTLVLMSIMICVQVPLLKNHFNKRFEA